MTAAPRAAPEWLVSLHGGHSGEFCDHAAGTLVEVLEAAERAGFATYGVSEHAPRLGERWLYASERDRGWAVEDLQHAFDAYAEASATLAAVFAPRLGVLRGFEAEVVPHDRYADVMRAYRARHGFDYMVGSVHFVAEVQIDGRPEIFAEAVIAAAGLESLAVAYYHTLSEAIDALRPEVVGHFDLIKRNARPYGRVDGPVVRRAARSALEAARAHGCILDLNTAGWRTGLGEPYPAPWIVREADRMGIPFCFGDDSHGPADVGRDIDLARTYLLQLGVGSITALERHGADVARRTIPLDEG